MPFTADDLRRALKDLDTLRYGAIDLHTALRRIVASTHDLFSVDGAALMLIDAELVLRNVAVSDNRLDELEELQLRHGVGPCIAAYHGKQLVSSEDLAQEHRWGEFAGDAVAAGLRSLLVSPIPYDSDAVGVVAVFSAKTHAWTPEGELALIAFTDLAALLIATTMQSDQRGEMTAQLQQALKSRMVVEQAKGILAERDHLTPRQAFERLRADARRARRKLADQANEVVRSVGSGHG